MPKGFYNLSMEEKEFWFVMCKDEKRHPSDGKYIPNETSIGRASTKFGKRSVERLVNTLQSYRLMIRMCSFKFSSAHVQRGWRLTILWFLSEINRLLPSFFIYLIVSVQCACMYMQSMFFAWSILYKCIYQNLHASRVGSLQPPNASRHDNDRRKQNRTLLNWIIQSLESNLIFLF